VSTVPETRAPEKVTQQTVLLPFRCAADLLPHPAGGRILKISRSQVGKQANRISLLIKTWQRFVLFHIYTPQFQLVIHFLIFVQITQIKRELTMQKLET
jgi:hypothetical protein